MRIPKGGIAFFDSGIGGMTVLSACMRYFKNEIFYYYGDNKRAPYGNLTEKKIKKYTMRAFKFFARKKVKAVVIACNTVTAVCVEELRQKYAFPIIGTEPALLPALRSRKAFMDPSLENVKQNDGKECIYVLVTRGTYNSKRFRQLYDKGARLYPQFEIKVFPCDRLAGAIERNVKNEKFDYREFLPNGNPEMVVLGCTHYIYIKKQIETYYSCRCVDGNNAIARRLLVMLKEQEKKDRKQRDKHKNIKKERKKQKIRKSIALVTTADPKNKNIIKNAILHKKTKTNKCSHFLRKSATAVLSKRGVNTIYFCGSGKRYNALFYKQMFVFDDVGGRNSQKWS